MIQLLTLLTGLLIAVMVSVNGNLTQQHGTFPAAAIIHGVGSLFAALLCALQKEKRPILGHRPRWMYLGGVIGVLATVFQNRAFGYISITSIVALGLLGQTVASLAIDSLGLFGMRKQTFQKRKLLGLACALAGIGMMLDGTVSQGAVAVGLSLGAGVAVVLSRTVNARLANRTGALRSSLVTHLAGLPITVVLALLAARDTPFAMPAPEEFRPWIYLGGMLGVTVVLLSNVTVPKISALDLTILTFVGQIFAGIALDWMAGDMDFGTSFGGGILIAVGMALNMILERMGAAKKRKQGSISPESKNRRRDIRGSRTALWHHWPAGRGRAGDGESCPHQ